MAIAKISSKFQVVIPREIRERFHMKRGQRLVFIPLLKSIQVVLVPTIKEARGMLPGLDTTVDREDEDRI
jgi:AbrB family looped-hinge helix DNA binding protein